MLKCRIVYKKNSRLFNKINYLRKGRLSVLSVEQGKMLLKNAIDL